MRADINKAEAMFHDAIKGFLGKREQGLVMGHFRAVLEAAKVPTLVCCEKMVQQAGNTVCCGEPIEAAPASSAIAMQAVDAERWCAVRDYLASTRADLDDDFLEACSSADTLLLCEFADNLILQSSQPSPVQLKEDLLPESLPYGIVDPDYARIFTMARVLAWAEGYAITMHGSFTRDLDLLAVPWTDRACEPEHLVRRIEAACKLRLNGHPPGAKSHGRLAWTLLFPEFGDPRFVDLSVMPRVHPSQEVGK